MKNKCEWKRKTNKIGRKDRFKINLHYLPIGSKLQILRKFGLNFSILGAEFPLRHASWSRL